MDALAATALEITTRRESRGVVVVVATGITTSAETLQEIATRRAYTQQGDGKNQHTNSNPT